MEEDFRPRPSLDSHTQPMRDQTRSAEPFLDPEDSSNTNNPYQSGLTTINIPESPSTVKKSSGNTDQPVDRSSFKSRKTARRLFNISQLKTLEFYQALLSEFLGTMLLTIVCTSTGLPIISKSVPDINGALAAGLIVATVVVGFGHISGAHINPAVTVTFLVASEIDVLRALCYIGAQLLGAISASALVRSITPLEAQSTLGMTMITSGVSLTQAFIVEFLITFILCYTVHSICDRHRDDVGGSKALAVGFAVTIGCLFGGPYTGASMNPARSFGPALIMNSWQNHWIYWLGPLTGSIAAAIIYTRILKAPKSTVIHRRSTTKSDI